ncbi:ribosomal protein S8 [Microdochium bolleyi]|uniref:Ribosomal protein S8 n=1 Tax=Microdochium bolleyi TaxID=196109 RepID=A0A136IXT2_9PEZI|nr:ribosomal protein S8 [Microdochium bolleyi]
MGVLNGVHMYSHLQNACRARLGLTSVPSNKYNLKIALALHKLGFLSFVARGGIHPPDPARLSSHTPEPLTTANVAQQRLWLGLKYLNNEPVMKTLRPISTPKRIVSADLRTLERVSRGQDTPYQRGLNLGECLIVGTDRGIMDSREAAERKIGGTLLFRVSP